MEKAQLSKDEAALLAYKNYASMLSSGEFYRLKKAIEGTTEDILLRKVSELSRMDLSELYTTYFISEDKVETKKFLLKTINRLANQ